MMNRQYERVLVRRQADEQAAQRGARAQVESQIALFGGEGVPRGFPIARGKVG